MFSVLGNGEFGFSRFENRVMRLFWGSKTGKKAYVFGAGKRVPGDGMGWGLEQRPSPGVWAQQLRLTHLLLSRGAGVGGKVLGSRQAGDGQGSEIHA